ncbi:hypothetical protein JXA88_10570 [Candidatus Fermentibacteria bacterium]|nr:hypothetical protein [Candidatus Fermentibacteria bacterium]
MVRVLVTLVLLVSGAAATTIQDVQTNPGLVGTIVTVEGVVTVPNSVYSSAPNKIAVIQDGTGSWSGIMIYCNAGLPTVNLGERLEVTGTVAEYYDRTELDLADPSDVTVLGYEGVPPVTWITAHDISDANPSVAEGYEGVLVGIENFTVAEIGPYEYTAQDGSGSCLIGWWSVEWSECPVNLGDMYSSVVGTADYSYSAYKLQPRFSSDYNFPVPVEFATLSAQSRGTEVVIRWSTITESDNFGFNVLRSEAVSGPFARVNEQLLPGAGTTMVPQVYLFADRHVTPGVTYFYMVQDIATDGATQDHGPVSCTFTPQSTSSWGAIKAQFAD